ncbi:MAG: ATP binding protein [Alyxoria varia]|nr:MAG: ATP binding protein [Alyxoria varia]
MSKFGTIILGPAGAGKTTFSSALLTHLATNRRSSIYVNLDPAAHDFAHPPDVDIRDLISLDDVMEELQLGPNGGLVYCFEYLLQNLDWLTTELESVSEEYLVVFDMPGQIELYTHVPVVPALVRHLRGGVLSMNLCAAYLLESTFVADRAKFFAGTLSAMSAMLNLELPHVNVLSKMDLIKGNVPRKELRRFIDPNADLLDDDPADDATFDEPAARGVGGGGGGGAESDGAGDPADSGNVMKGASFKRLNRGVAQLVEEFGMVSFLELDVTVEESVGGVLSFIDECVQFHEAQEPKELRDEDVEME